jgi:hypothetical protein
LKSVAIIDIFHLGLSPMVFYCFATKEYQRWKDPSTKKSCYFRLLTVVLPVGASPKVECFSIL